MVTTSFVENEMGDPLHPLTLPGIDEDDLIENEEINAETDEEVFMRCMDDLESKAEELEKKVNEVSELLHVKNRKAPKGTSALKEKENLGAAINITSTLNNKDDSGGAKNPVDGSRQELMRQFGTILRQISQHKWAGPFMDPVDAKSLGLHDYYKIIKKPMDLSTIRKKLEAKNGPCYGNVSDIYADTRLVFTNAMTYNDERSDIHVMAKTLLAKLEGKWLLLWPKVVEEESRQKEEEVRALANMHVARESAIGQMASDTDNELSELNLQLEELREMVIQKCRKWSAEEKRKLGAGLCALSVENLSRALEIIAQSNPGFQPFGEEVEFDMDAQSEATLWRLKFFVREALRIQRKSAKGGSERSLKRKREMHGDLTKTDNKRSRKACLSLK